MAGYATAGFLLPIALDSFAGKSSLQISFATLFCCVAFGDHEACDSPFHGLVSRYFGTQSLIPFGFNIAEPHLVARPLKEEKKERKKREKR